MWQTIESLDADLIRSRRYGVIEIVEGHFTTLQFRPWPKIVSLVDILWFGKRYHAQTPGDQCWLYYNQPRRCPNFLALTYVLSTRNCTLATVRRGLEVLDNIARIKQTDAILCDAWNSRISDRLLARWGWEPHTNQRWHRNYIKRFYGQYPPASSATNDLAVAGAAR